ncbi:FAD/NAD(P)-binding domain-containing protein [Phlyctochytrium arcticum]|nr:FAD/NAD(P)-binding domain-containing protein [Phlyctochytrium arcticum]
MGGSLTRRTYATTIGKSQGRLVVLGSGWAGLKIVGGVNVKDYEVIMVSPRNHFVFTPLLASTSGMSLDHTDVIAQCLTLAQPVGTLEFRNITEPVRHHQRKAKYYQAWCDNIDIHKKEIMCTPALPGLKPFSLAYDKLVIAVGAYSNTFGIPGVEKHGLFLKEISHAQKIRARIIECFEMASEPNTSELEQWKLLHFAVVGGGPTGVEFSAELHDFVKDDLAKLYPELMNKVQITVYDVAEKILGGFDDALASYAAKKFARSGIQIRTRTFIKEVKDGKLVLKDDTEIPFGALVWATGLTATPLIRNLPVTHTKSQKVLTDEYLRVLDTESKPVEDIYALGDCATIKGNELPATAQVANQQGVWLRKHLNAFTREGLGKPFHYSHIASMVYIGSWNAIFDTTGGALMSTGSGGSPGLRGRIAWFVWRSAYLIRSVSVRNMINIPLHWFMTW